MLPSELIPNKPTEPAVPPQDQGEIVQEKSRDGKGGDVVVENVDGSSV